MFTNNNSNDIQPGVKPSSVDTSQTTTNARMVSYSMPSPEFKAEGLDDVQDLIAFCARVSNPSNQYNKETSAKLIQYLIKHKHWSPLETVSACIEIETTRDIGRQILRHRSFSFLSFGSECTIPMRNILFIPSFFIKILSLVGPTNTLAVPSLNITHHCLNISFLVFSCFFYRCPQ